MFDRTHPGFPPDIIFSSEDELMEFDPNIDQLEVYVYTCVQCILTHVSVLRYICIQCTWNTLMCRESQLAFNPLF